MTVWTLLALSVALAMDAFAVAIATGMALKQVSGRQVFRLGWHFGLFQALMPVAGWIGGLTVRGFIQAFDHWVAFALLAVIGGRMVWGALHPDHSARASDPTRGLSLVMLSVATSIDALAVGLGLAVLKVSIWGPALVIGLVAGAFTVGGLHLGRALGTATRLDAWAEAIGGLVLLGIGFNILSEHGVFQVF